ncbi:MAG TPA: hypothetical protein VG937_06380 [Polyangiaceae bacterium]|jgi:hypothetical protein|nr:hypothetical protein [Polyangiaceae bacterium]
MRRLIGLGAAIVVFVLLSAGTLSRGSSSAWQPFWAFGVVALAVGLWLGPAAWALRLARRSSGRSRRAYGGGALVACAPLLFLEIVSIADALRSYDGYCHGFPDAHHPCSLAEAVLSAALGGSGVALFGWLVLGVPAFAFGAVTLLVSHCVAERHGPTPSPYRR